MRNLRPSEFWIVALFLSKYSQSIKGKNTEPPYELHAKTWNEAYKRFYNCLGSGYSETSFINSLKNCRDTFDGHTKSSGRVGWKENFKPMMLSKIAARVFTEYNAMSRDALWLTIQKLISEKNRSKISSFKKTNPDWTREELILALDLYYNLNQGQMHKGHPDVIKLSNELRVLNFHKHIPDKTKFRNPSGISRRLGNFKTMDSSYSGKGLRNSGKLAKEIFIEFSNNRNKLKKEADLIRQLYLKNEIKSKVSEEIDKYNTDYFYKYHKNRETDPLVLKVKKSIVNADYKKLKCEVCGFDSVEFYGEIADDLMEIHYNKEFNEEKEILLNDINDFIIVCSNCHKVLDKHFGFLDATDLKKLILKK